MREMVWLERKSDEVWELGLSMWLAVFLKKGMDDVKISCFPKKPAKSKEGEGRRSIVCLTFITHQGKRMTRLDKYHWDLSCV